MHILLFVLAFIAALIGGATFSAAKSAIHEIEAGVLFLSSAVFLVGAVITNAIDAQSKETRKTADRLSKILISLDEVLSHLKPACASLVSSKSLSSPPPPLPELPPSDQFYVSIDGSVNGPISSQKVRELAARMPDKQIHVMMEGAKEWQPIADFLGKA